ncbi:hypothetical protein BC628DRAFT_780312 [Trametes gibbosa]|nr:hypothetical protein BC628DRAFT_780312 [Trametes gibbosa]
MLLIGRVARRTGVWVAEWHAKVLLYDRDPSLWGGPHLDPLEYTTAQSTRGARRSRGYYRETGAYVVSCCLRQNSRNPFRPLAVSQYRAGVAGNLLWPDGGGGCVERTWNVGFGPPCDVDARPATRRRWGSLRSRPLPFALVGLMLLHAPRKVRANVCAILCLSGCSRPASELVPYGCCGSTMYVSTVTSALCHPRRSSFIFSWGEHYDFRHRDARGHALNVPSTSKRLRAQSLWPDEAHTERRQTRAGPGACDVHCASRGPHADDVLPCALFGDLPAVIAAYEV